MAARAGWKRERAKRNDISRASGLERAESFGMRRLMRDLLTAARDLPKRRRKACPTATEESRLRTNPSTRAVGPCSGPFAALRQSTHSSCSCMPAAGHEQAGLGRRVEWLPDMDSNHD